MLHEFLQNFLHNLFKPLLLFFYFGFLLRILKVDFEFPYVIYQGLTMYLLLAIGWHGGEELAAIKASSVGQIVGFMATGFCLNFVIGVLAYLLLSRLTALRRVDKATVAGYYGSDSAGTFATCVAFLSAWGWLSTPTCRSCWPSWRSPAAWSRCIWWRGCVIGGWTPTGTCRTSPATLHRCRRGSVPARPPNRLPDRSSTSSRNTEERVQFALEKRSTSRAGRRSDPKRRAILSRQAAAGGLPQSRTDVCSSAASSSASSAGCRDTRSLTTPTPSSSRPSRARSACSCSRWA